MGLLPKLQAEIFPDTMPSQTKETYLNQLDTSIFDDTAISKKKTHQKQKQNKKTLTISKVISQTYLTTFPWQTSANGSK